ncbi:unknown [Clostridium sp. CAG:1013]|nr:unknown [Clostridium sp. CAG:1013]
MPRLFDHRRSRGQAEHHIPAAPVNGFPDHLDLFLCGVGIVGVGVGIADVVHFYKVHAPCSVQLKNGIVIGLGSLFGSVHAVHVGVPLTDRSAGSDLVAGGIRALHRQMLMHRLPRHAPHDVDAEFQTHAVDLLRDRAEPFPARRGGEPLRRGKLPAVLVQSQPGKGHIIRADFSRVGLAPLDVAYHVFPAEFLQMVRHILGVAQKLFLIDRGTVTVPAVPPQRGSQRHLILFHENCLLL